MSGTSAFHLARTVSKSPVPLIKFIVSAVLLNFLSPNEAALAQSLQPRVLHNFSGQANPMAPLVEGPDGCFYGTTVGGGSGGRGAVFKVTPDGAFTTLAVFTLYDGKSPNGLVLGSDGNFYGTTIQGGSSGFGTVFRMAPDGALTTLAHFNNANGAFPAGRLVPYRHGEFYGTTVTGTNYNGTVFKVTKNGTLTTLANFPSAYESFPGGLTLGQDGSFYGTTYGGWEKAFRVTRRGKLTTLANLAGISYPYATGLTLCNDGNFYGTTFEGGCHRLGTVFRVTRHGAVTTLVNFNGRNGALPAGGLTLGSDGNFYGTTIYGGTFEGTVFKMTTDGKLTTLANFTDRLHGVRPYGGVTVGDNGSLYGTTITGGSGDSGIIFRVDLPPSILSQPASRFKGRGATATFIVAATGTKPFSYQWLKNGRKMVDGCNVRGANSNTLVLANVETSDGGNFAVVVTNHWGSVTSDVAVLTVLEGGHSMVASWQVDVYDRSLAAGDSRASGPAAVAGPHIKLTFEGVPNSQYLVQYATNLTSSPWFNLSTNSASADGTWMVVDPIVAGEQRFYRVASPPAP